MKRDFSLGKPERFDRRQFLQRTGMLAGGILSGSFSPGVASMGGYLQQQGAGTAASTLTAFVDVTVVPMDRERLLGHQTVLVRGERIAEIGSAAAVPVPAGALRIDGRGRYLMPGLADMHVHYEDPASNIFYNIFYVANGVTTVRSMWGRRQDLVERTRIAKGETLGPTIFTCGPVMSAVSAWLPQWGEGWVALSDPREAERAVADQKASGYDFVKVTDVSRDVYDAIVAAAKRHNLPVLGHIPRQVGLLHALKSGQASIEHLWGYLEAIVREDAPAPPEVVNAADWVRAQMALEEYVTQYVDESKIPAVARATRDARTWNCVTLMIYFTDYNNIAKRPGIEFVPSSIRKNWEAYMAGAGTDNPPQRSLLKNRDRANVLRVKITRALRDAGAGILLGTDSTVPGFCLHEELHYLVRAGLTPYEAIRAGTYDAADFLHALDDFGTVAVGRRADLILAAANPLQDVANIARRVGVMVRGRWLPQSELQTMLEEMGAK